jgi:hypothetical protein
MATSLSCWLIHNILVGSVSGILSDLGGMAGNAVVLYRSHLRKPKAPATPGGAAERMA